jgi:signal peptidase II
MKERIKHLILFIILVGIDQASKFWVRTNLMGVGKKPIIIIPDVLNLQFHSNTGAVWGIFNDKVIYLALFTFVVLSGIVFLYFKIPNSKKHKVLKTIAVFIMAGAVGNLIDRIFLGYVTDFIYFEIINFPLFNFADSCLTVSSILLLILALFYFKDEDFAFLDQLFRKKKAVAEGKAEKDTSANDREELNDISDFDGEDNEEDNKTEASDEDLDS